MRVDVASRITSTIYPLCSPMPAYLPPLLLFSLSSPSAPRPVAQFIAHFLQPTKLQYYISANVIVHHIMACACRTVTQLRSQFAVKSRSPVLRLFVVSRAILALACSTTCSIGRPSTTSTALVTQPRRHNLQVMGGAATALNATIVVRVR